MADIRIKLNTDSLGLQLEEKSKQIKKQFIQAVQSLAVACHAHILEQAGEKLKSLQAQYKSALDFEQVDDTLWVVSLNASARWIEEGTKARSGYDMLSTSKKAKTSKDGHKYLIIPFEHSKVPSQQSASARSLTDQIRSFLKKQNIPYKKIEYNEDGSPKLGLIHKFDINSAQPKGAKNQLLQGVAIYQHKNEQGKVKRDIMTFRVISDRNKGDGKWEYKERNGINIFPETEKWAYDTWQKTILPALIDSLK